MKDKKMGRPANHKQYILLSDLEGQIMRGSEAGYGTTGKVWFITGASRGIGKALTETALKNGDSVIATTRKENGLEVSREYADRFPTLTTHRFICRLAQTPFLP